jgi:hypothetical protein
MTTSTPRAPSAFHALERALLRRRLLGVEPGLRGPLAVLAALIAAFVFWQMRVPLDGLVRARGAVAGLIVLACVLGGLALLGAVLVHGRHRRTLRAGPDGPAWLALPIAPPALARHLAWNDAWHALPVTVPAAGVTLAGWGLVPAPALVILAAGHAIALVAGARAGCTMARLLETPPAPPRRALPPLVRALTRVPPESRRERVPAARWRSGGPARALLANDLARSRRPGESRHRLALALALLTLSGIVWLVPVAAASGPTLFAEANTAHALALGLALVAAAAFGEWLITTACGDPFEVVRALPLGLPHVWAARLAFCALFALAFAALHAVLAWPLDGSARALFIAWIGAACFLVTTLALHYGVTLHPHAGLARRVFGYALGFALVTSVMLPMAGWLVLLAAVAHSGRRLPRWSRAEGAA